jgi:hypothetical protein
MLTHGSRDEKSRGVKTRFVTRYDTGYDTPYMIYITAAYIGYGTNDTP